MTLNISAGIFPALAKSYAYDNSNYIQADPVSFSIAAALSSKATFTAFTKKQVKSITIVPTTAATVNDQWVGTYITLGPVAYGTATGGSYLGTGTYVVGGTTTNGAGFVNASGTQTATGSNIVYFTTLTNLGTQPAYNPCYVPIAGGTFTVVVVNGVGTNTQTNYVFPQGPNGGLSMLPGDVLVIGKGTDSVAVYQGELEMTFTPGTTLTL